MARQSRPVLDGSDGSYPGNVLGDMPQRYLSGNFPTKMRFDLEYLIQGLRALRKRQDMDKHDALLAREADKCARDLAAYLGPLTEVWHLAEGFEVETGGFGAFYQGPEG